MTHHQSICQHIGIFVHDLEKMSRFYTQELGFQIQKDNIFEAELMKEIFGLPSACRMRYLAYQDLGIELFQFQDIPLMEKNMRMPGYNHWTLLVEDKYQFCGQLEAKNVPVIKIAKSHGHTFFIKDPEDNLIEIKSFDL